MQVFLLLVVVALAGLTEAQEGTCLWRGVCGYNPKYEGDDTRCLNCYVEEKPRRLQNDTALKLLFDVCPHFREDLGEDPYVCCTPFQIESLKYGYNQAEGILGSCPTCFANFKKNFCGSTCHPQMASFSKATKIHRGKKEACGGRPDPSKLV